MRRPLQPHEPDPDVTVLENIRIVDGIDPSKIRPDAPPPKPTMPPNVQFTEGDPRVWDRERIRYRTRMQLEEGPGTMTASYNTRPKRRKKAEPSPEWWERGDRKTFGEMLLVAIPTLVALAGFAFLLLMWLSDGPTL